MNDSSLVARSLSARAHTASARVLGAPSSRDREVAAPAVAPGLIESLRHHLHDGETHYPVRPGMVELRERIASRLEAWGLPPRGAGSVLITAGEGEALFATLLGLGLAPGGLLVGEGPSGHADLLSWMDVRVAAVDDSTEEGPVAYLGRGRGTPRGEAPRMVFLRDALFLDQAADPPAVDAGDVLIGSLDGVGDMAPFRLGYVAADPDVVQRITKWKQAFSICSPAPSQRAALFAMGVRP